MLKLRPYQIETHDALRYHYERGNNRLMVNLATGLGKTSAVAAVLPETFPDLAKHGLLFLSHRREILYQAYRTFKAKWGKEKWIGLEMGEYHATGQEDFVFASVDSIGRLIGSRINKFGHRHFGIVVADEGHHVSQDGTWDNILNFFGVGSDTSQFHTFPGGAKPLSVFLTATPVRADGQALAPFLDDVAVSFDIRYGIREGWLTDIKCYHAELANEDYSGVDAERQVDFLIKTWMAYGEGMRTLAFARNVQQSELLAGALSRELGLRAGHVDATTPDEIRQDIVGRFALPYGDPNAIELVSNRLIFTEGYDNPGIQCILDNAPTDSQSLYIQKIGRGLRPVCDLSGCLTAADRKEAIRLSAKPFLTYITTFPLKHGLDMAATLFGLPKNVDTNGKLIEEIIDVIQYEEETMPEAPTRDLSGMDGMEIRLKRQDVWTQTVYNEELRAMTPLRWVVGENFAAIRLFRNPFSNKPNDQTPVIITWSREGDKWRLNRVLEGGWIPELKRPRRSQLDRLPSVEADLNAAIRKTDRALKEKFPDIHADLQRDHSGPASENLKTYLKRKKVAANYDALTAETGMILKDDAVIRPKLIEFGLPAE